MHWSGLSFASLIVAAKRPLAAAAQSSQQVGKAGKVGNGLRDLGILGLALSIGLAGAAVGQPTSDITSTAKLQLAADTALTTTSGATFTAPSGWTVTSSTNKRIL